MRLIAWNANFNNRRRSFEETVALLEPLESDILVLSEVAPPAAGVPGRVQSLGNSTPCLAVAVGPAWYLETLPENAAAPSLAGAFLVNGPVRFGLLAIWPVQTAGAASTYHQILMDALGLYEPFCLAGPTVLAGDLNSSSGVVAQRQTHPQFVRRAEELGLVSVYHSQTGERHGEESLPTYRQRFSETETFHLDYCFVSKGLSAAARVTILSDGEWPSRSDHFPVILDIPNGAFPASAAGSPAI